MNKRDLVARIIDQLGADLGLHLHAADAARTEAVDEQSRAENKYDTRGLEASYLARGQSRQAAELERAIDQFQKLAVRPFAADEPVNLGAWVELKNGRETAAYFVGPRAGGTQVIFEEREVTIITPESPLGGQLIGRRAGEKFVWDLGGARQELKITRIL